MVEMPGQRFVAFEVKATSAPGRDDARHLFWLRDTLGDRLAAAVVLHTGARVFSLGERVVAVPIAALWDDGLG